MTASDDAFSKLRRSFEELAPMPGAVWENVRRAWHLAPVRQGEVLAREGEVEKTFTLVLEGVQRLYFRAPGGGEEVTVAFAYPYDYSGVPDSFFLQTPSAYTLKALTDGQVLATTHEDFAALMDRHRELERWAWRLLAATLSARAERERRLLTMTAQERYERLLRESPQLLQLAPLKHVASYLGMSPETLSRARAEAA